MNEYSNNGVIYTINGKLSKTVVRKYNAVTIPFLLGGIIIDKITLAKGKYRHCPYSSDIYLIGQETIWLLKQQSQIKG